MGRDRRIGSYNCDVLGRVSEAEPGRWWTLAVTHAELKPISQTQRQIYSSTTEYIKCTLGL